MLFCARYQQEPTEDNVNNIVVTINYGEFVFGLKGWSERLGVGVQVLRTFIKKLLQTNMIELTAHFCTFTVYKVVNYQKYNTLDNTLVNTLDNTLNHASKKQLRVGVEQVCISEDNALVNTLDNTLTNILLTPSQQPLNTLLTTYNKDNKDNNIICDTQSKKIKKFIPPTLEQVTQYCKDRNNLHIVNPETWLSYYECNGWKVNKNPMKDWKASIRYWESKNNKNNATLLNAQKAPKHETKLKEVIFYD